MILLIHGISQQRYIGREEELLALWLRYLSSNKSNTTDPDVTPAVSRMGFYADLTDPSSMSLARNVQASSPDTLYNDIVYEMCAAENTKALRNTRIAHALATLMDSRPSLRREVLRQVAYEAFIYLSNSDLRNHVIDRVLSSVERSDMQLSAVVGHSLGSVVAYDLFKRYPNVCETLITIGSPLGSSAFIERIGSRERVFEGLKQWHDFYDDEDIVSFKPVDINKLFTTGTDGIAFHQHQVENSTDTRHGAEGYLTSPKISQLVRSKVLRV